MDTEKLFQTFLLLVVITMSNLFCSCKSPAKGPSPKLLFEDHFDQQSCGAYRENIIQLPPPAGLGFTWKVTAGGFDPVNWVFSDELENDNPKKGFWVIPPDSGYLEQAGRSHNSVLFANTPIPEDCKHYLISFKQYRNDNDPILYVIGARQPNWNQGMEFGYMTQEPGTDSTTNHAFTLGIVGETLVENMAFSHQWVEHTIEVQGNSIRWNINEHPVGKAEIAGPKSGYFGIRQKYERGTRYDDFKIILNPGE